METKIPLIWYLAMSFAFGLLPGYAIGMAIGISLGKKHMLSKIKLALERNKVKVDIDRVLKGGRTFTI